MEQQLEAAPDTLIDSNTGADASTPGIASDDRTDANAQAASHTNVRSDANASTDAPSQHRARAFRTLVPSQGPIDLCFPIDLTPAPPAIDLTAPPAAEPCFELPVKYESQ